MKTSNEFDHILVSGALDDTKKMRKAGADIFAKSGPEKNTQNQKKKNMFSVIFPGFSCGVSQKPVNSLTNGWEPSGNLVLR